MIFDLHHFNVLSSRDLTWNNRPRENPYPMGIIEDSDLRCKGYQSHHNLEKQVYDDACDTGFVVRSERTDLHVLYAYYNRLEREGEVQVWIYRSIKQWCTWRQRWVNCDKMTEIHIIND